RLIYTAGGIESAAPGPRAAGGSPGPELRFNAFHGLQMRFKGCDPEMERNASGRPQLFSPRRLEPAKSAKRASGHPRRRLRAEIPDPGQVEVFFVQFQRPVAEAADVADPLDQVARL